MKRGQSNAPTERRQPRLLTYKQVAEECSICTVTVRRAVARGELESVNAPGTVGNSGKRITAESLQRYLSGQRVAARAG